MIGVLLFLWLMGKVSGLLFRLAWGVVKVVAILLLAAALPILYGDTEKSVITTV